MEIQPKRPSTKGPAEMFTGDVWFDVIAQAGSGCGSTSSGSRPAPAPPGTATPTGRPCTSPTGVGLVQSRGGEVVEIRAGDTVHTPPGEWHWHGAAPDHFMAHLAMWESLGEGQDGPETEWGDHVDLS